VRGASQSCHFMGLPGNPVSSWVTFMLLVRPFVLALQGVSATALPMRQAVAQFNLPKPDRRREFLRVRETREGLQAFPNQSSGVLTSVVWADGLLDNPPGQSIAVGDTVRWVSWNDWAVT
jgi:molybdopterin molybdotransferase